METFTKQSSETINYTLDFTEAVNDGDVVISSPAPAVTLANVNGSVAGDVPPTIDSVTLNVGANTLKVAISGGTDGETYLITAIVSTQDDEVLEGNCKLKIKDIG